MSLGWHVSSDAEWSALVTFLGAKICGGQTEGKGKYLIGAVPIPEQQMKAVLQPFLVAAVIQMDFSSQSKTLVIGDLYRKQDTQRMV